MYAKVAHILRSINENSNKSIKTIIYDNITYEDSHFKKIYKLVMEILKNKGILNSIIANYFDNNLNKEHLMTFLYEMYLSGKKAKIGGKLVKVIKEREREIQEYLKGRNTPQYQSTRELMFFRFTNDDHIPTIKGLTKDDFITDLFYIDKREHNESLVQIFQLKKKDKLLIQSKSSCLPAFLLSLISNQMTSSFDIDHFDIIDTCSAPGNKTLQLGKYFPKAQVFAFEMDKNRYEFLNENVKRFNTEKNIQTVNLDFLLTDPNDEKFSGVKVILVDPSCSGSGTTHNSVVDDVNLTHSCSNDIAGSDAERENIKRLTNLAKFQIKILDHCLKFPNVKYISYSTCSIFMTENEFVVERVLKSNLSFRLVDLEDKDKLQYHPGLTEETRKTIRICSHCHNSDGFYVALFERI